MSDHTFQRAPVLPRDRAVALFWEHFVWGHAGFRQAWALKRALWQAWARFSPPRWFLLARATAEGWEHSRHDLATGEESRLEPAQADRLLAEAASRLPWLRLLGAALAVAWGAWVVADFSLGGAVLKALLLGAAWLTVWLAHLRWGTFYIAYELDRDARSRRKAVRNAFAALRGCNGVWNVDAQGAGGVAPVPFPAAVRTTGRVPNVVISTPPCALASGSRAVYFLPDKVLVLDVGRVRLAGYTACAIVADSVVLPAPDGRDHPDAEVISRRFKHANPDATRAPGMTNNPSIPVLRLGRVQLDIGQTRLELLTTNPHAPARFREHFFSTPAVTDEDAGADDALPAEGMAVPLGGLRKGTWRAVSRALPATLGTVRRVPARAWLVLAILIALASATGYIIWLAGAAQRDFTQADALFDAGDRPAAVALYRKHPERLLRPDGTGATALGRVVEDALERGDYADARTWLERAIEHGTRPDLTSVPARQLYEVVLAEHERRLATAEAQRRQQVDEEERKRRAPQEEADRKKHEAEETEARAILEEGRRKREERKRREEEEARRQAQQEEQRRQEALARADAKAAPHVRYARKLIDQGDVERGIARLKEVVRDYPQTPSAAEARQLLKELGEK